MGVGKETSQGELSFLSPSLSPLCGAVYVFFGGGRELKERLKDGCVQTNGQRSRVQVKGQLLIHI